MEPITTQILVFKTNINNPWAIERAGFLLQRCKAIVRWNIDLHDTDNVLRIVGADVSPAIIITLVNQAGFYCQELE